MAAVKERRAKAEGKVARALKALESAQKELADVAAAERVLADITGESTEPKAGDGSVSPRDIEIAKLLPSDPAEAISPAELYPVYLKHSGDDINVDAFRTAVWRLLKKTIRGEVKTWIVKSDNGKYWREAVRSGRPDDDDENEFEGTEEEDDLDSLL